MRQSYSTFAFSVAQFLFIRVIGLTVFSLRQRVAVYRSVLGWWFFCCLILLAAHCHLHLFYAKGRKRVRIAIATHRAMQMTLNYTYLLHREHFPIRLEKHYTKCQSISIKPHPQ